MQKKKKKRTMPFWVKGTLTLAFGLMSMLSLISYHKWDSAWNTASDLPTQNWLGCVGAYLADALLQMLGEAAFMVPVVLLVIGVFILMKKNHIRWRVTGLIVALILITWLRADASATDWLKAGKGGFVGKYLSAWYAPQQMWIQITGWMICALLIILSFKVPVIKLGKWTGLGFLWGMKKIPVKVPEKMKKPFKQIYVKAQVNKIKKSAPKEKVKATVVHKKKADIMAELNEESAYILPSSELLAPVKASASSALSKEVMTQIAEKLESVLKEFCVQGKITKFAPGPVVTLYSFEPASGVKVSRVISLAEDVAREMMVPSVRMAVIPGTNAIGIEMPNPTRETVYIRDMMEQPSFQEHTGALPIILGKDIGGRSVYADLAKMPHMLVAGTTGSGKSVGINTMILSLLYRFTPEQCRLILVDPKMVELSVYNGIPHLLTPVVTEPPKALMALKWAVHEMEDRYRSMSQLGVRNITGFNEKLKQAKAEGIELKRRVQTGFDAATGEPIMEERAFDLTPLPYIVFIIDEMADLMGQCGKEADPLIQRLAQMARAVGIHLILATQRPSVDVITGTIKSNFPSRISFQVRNKIDSRTILDEQGAEQLLGRGDMLYMPAGNKPTRVHGPFVADEDVLAVVKHWSHQGKPEYVDAVVSESANMASGGGMSGGGNSGDDLYDKAVQLVLRDKKPTTSYIQRRLSIGYNKAADLIERMEADGIISAPNVAGKREILSPNATGGEV